MWSDLRTASDQAASDGMQRWPEPPRGLSRSRYVPTFRGETRIPNFSDSSWAILFSHPVAFSRAIRSTNSRRSFGTAGRPGLRDFHRQKTLNAVRCHPTEVSGFTTTNTSRQSKNFASPAIARRIEAVVRRGLILRSWNEASCFRRNRFSATRATRSKRNSRMNVSKSVSYRNVCAFRPFRPNCCGAQVSFGLFPADRFRTRSPVWVRWSAHALDRRRDGSGWPGTHKRTSV
jgi:hypothetical protein